MEVSIIVCAENEPDWMSRQIMRVIGAEYSHIAIVVDESVVYHMVGKGFCKMPYIDLAKDHKIWMQDITDKIESMDFVAGYLEGRLGVQYSQSQYLGFLFPWTRRFVNNNREKGVCSEEVARFLLLCGKKEHVSSHFNKLDKLDFVSPKDVWEALTDANMGV